MLKIFMTGDNHIGLKYARHEKAEEIKNARIEAFGDMVKKADEEDCGLFVVTGDLFENNHSILKRDISAVINYLSAFKGHVAVLPGNHDFYDKNAKLWQHFGELSSSSDNIMVLSDFRPYVIDVKNEKVTLYPALCQTSHSQPGENNLGWIKNEDMSASDGYRIGVAHGTVEGETIDNEGEYFLMKRKELEDIPVDAWLIGHTHVPFPNNLKENEYTEGVKIFNAGSHVQPNVACNTEGECFIIEIDPEKTVRAKKFMSGNIRFFRKNIPLSAGRMEEILSAELNSLPEKSVVDIILSGAVSIEEYEKRAELIENSLSRFIEGAYSDFSLTRLISKELIDAEFAETSFCAKFLTALLDRPKEAQLTYDLLKTLKEEK